MAISFHRGDTACPRKVPKPHASRSSARHSARLIPASVARITGRAEELTCSCCCGNKVEQPAVVLDHVLPELFHLFGLSLLLRQLSRLDFGHVGLREVVPEFLVILGGIILLL